MSNKTSGVIFFVSGFVCGFVLARHYISKRWEGQISSELNAVRERLKKDREEDRSSDISVDLSAYEDMVQEHRYYGGVKDSEHPYLITPEEFGENEEYETIELNYYADGVLADDNDDVIDDISETIGDEALNHFGDHEDDAVFVRNETRKVDFEIVLDKRTYSEVVGVMSSGKEDS